MAFHTGELLVATPQLVDPNFARSVILVLDHDGDGALGVVLNRPTQLSLGSVLPSWAGSVTGPDTLFAGGPVARDSALAVGLAAGDGPPAGFKPLVNGYGLVDLDADPLDVIPGLVGLRVFSGYAGWGDAQLEAEIQEGSWYVVSALPHDLLAAEPDQLWRQVLRRQPGELAYLATFPEDPTLN